MKFGIFVFGDNHPESGFSIRDYYQDVLKIGAATFNITGSMEDRVGMKPSGLCGKRG